jgi:hypothetical protein
MAGAVRETWGVVRERGVIPSERSESRDLHLAEETPRNWRGDAHCQSRGLSRCVRTRFIAA